MAVLLGPRPQRKAAGGLIRTQQVDGAPEALHPGLGGLDRERKIENGGRVALVLHHGLEAADAGAARLEGVAAGRRSLLRHSLSYPHRTGLRRAPPPDIPP